MSKKAMQIKVSTVTGCGKDGYLDGKVEDAYLNYPSGICTSEDGKIYFIDYYNNCIRMIADGRVSTIAGSGEEGYLDGKAEDAMFHGPAGICCDINGNLYIAESKTNRIRMISNGMVSTIAGCGEEGLKDGKAEEAMFNYPMSICLSDDGDLYIADTSNHVIRVLSDGVVRTFAGCDMNGYQDGKAENAMFDWPTGICMLDHDNVCVSDSHNNCIRIISNGLVSSIAGCGKEGFEDGKAEDAMFYRPSGVCTSEDGKIIVTDQRNCSIRMISDGIVSTLAGNGTEGFRDGEGENTRWNWPDAVCVSSDGEIYVTDTLNHSIRMISGLPISSKGYFELSSLLNGSKSISDMTLTINNQQYHLHTAVIDTLCPLLVKHISIIEDAKISHESLQTMFEMIYSNNTIKIRKSKPDQYQMADLGLLIELIWLFESFEIKNESFIETCIKQLKIRLKYLMKHDERKSAIETLKNELIHRTDELIALSQLHGLQTTKLVQINHFINQNESQNGKSSDNNSIIATMDDIFILFGSHTEPRVVDQQQIQSVIAKSVLDTQPDYTIMTHDRSYSIKCHKLILYAKWSYFRRMIESGLLESASGEMIMSEDWNATRLFDFVKYLYTHEVKFESIEDCRWLLDSAELYGLVEISANKENPDSKIVKRDYKLLIESCRARVLDFEASAAS